MFTTRIILFLLIAFSLGGQPGYGQERYKTVSGKVTFNASTPLEDIQANNQQVNAILKNSGEFAVVLLVKEFEFPRKLMQEHFNENYLESDTFPKSYFVGEIPNFRPESITETSERVTIKGKLHLHGVTQQVTVAGNIKRVDKGIQLQSKFSIRPEDYAIEIPTLMFKKIAEEVQVSFEFSLIPNP